MKVVNFFLDQSASYRICISYWAYKIRHPPVNTALFKGLFLCNLAQLTMEWENGEGSEMAAAGEAKDKGAGLQHCR